MGDDDADRAGERGRLGDDHILAAAVGHRHVVSAAGRDRTHADDDRQITLLHERREPVEDLVAAGHRAPRGLDPEDDRLDRLVLGDPIDLLAGESRPPHDRSDHVDNRHPAGGILGERVPAFLDLPRLLEVAGVGAEAGHGHHSRQSGDHPGKPREASSTRGRRVGRRGGEGRRIHRGRLPCCDLSPAPA